MTVADASKMAKPEGFEVPNLDGLSIDPADLLAVSAVYGVLACYAEYAGRAMQHRLGGDIEAALSFERAAEVQYRKLPQWARW